MDRKKTVSFQIWGLGIYDIYTNTSRASRGGKFQKVKGIIYYIYDGSSKVLFPLLALNRNSMRDAFCFTCKKIIQKIQVKCSKSISLEKRGSFPAKRASAQICLIIRLFVQKI